MCIQDLDPDFTCEEHASHLNPRFDEASYSVKAIKVLCATVDLRAVPTDLEVERVLAKKVVRS